jgi:hypothetical protein
MLVALAPALARARSPQTVDKRAPRLLLDGDRRQRLNHTLAFYATCSERCQFFAEARVHSVYGMHSAHVFTPGKASNGGRRVRFVIRLSGRAHALIRRAFRHGNHPSITALVTAVDLAQNESNGKLLIRLKPA